MGKPGQEDAELVDQRTVKTKLAPDCRDRGRTGVRAHQLSRWIAWDKVQEQKSDYGYPEHARYGMRQAGYGVSPSLPQSSHTLSSR